MVDDMSESEHDQSAALRAPLTFGTIVVVGGGCYGSYYVRQLRRAAAADAVRWKRLLVVDRDPGCAIARARDTRGSSYGIGGLELVVSDWRAFFRAYLDAASSDRTASSHDAIVPSPLMPHLMFEWLLARARERWPGRDVGTRPLGELPAIPWQRETDSGPHYVSFATWTCPINCIEPRICPHTRERRDWSLPDAARNYIAEEQGKGHQLAGPVIFHCTHRAYGVGMFDTAEVVAGDDLVQRVAEQSAAELLVGTMSHCHGAFERLVIGPPASHGFAASRH
jgi:hypothetical protein